MIEVFQRYAERKSGNIINIGSDLSVIAPDQRLYKSIKNYKPVSYSVVKNGILVLLNIMQLYMLKKCSL